MALSCIPVLARRAGSKQVVSPDGGLIACQGDQDVGNVAAMAHRGTRPEWRCAFMKGTHKKPPACGWFFCLALRRRSVDGGARRGERGGAREMLTIPGGYKGREGSFEFIKDANGAINRRLFKPEKEL